MWRAYAPAIVLLLWALTAPALGAVSNLWVIALAFAVPLAVMKLSERYRDDRRHRR